MISNINLCKPAFFSELLQAKKFLFSLFYKIVKYLGWIMQAVLNLHIHQRFKCNKI